MKHSDAIRRAVGRIPTPELPADFPARVMRRLRRAERRRQRLERVLTGICSAGCLAGVAAVGYWALARRAEESGREMFRHMTDGSVLPHPGWSLPHIDLSPLRFELPIPGNSGQWTAVGFLAAAGLVLLVADLLIRRRLDSQRKQER